MEILDQIHQFSYYFLTFHFNISRHGIHSTSQTSLQQAACTATSSLHPCPLWLHTHTNNTVSEKKPLALCQECEVASEELVAHELKYMQTENIPHVNNDTKAAHGGRRPPSAHLEGRKTERAVSEWVVSSASAVAILWPRWQFDCLSHPLLYPAFLVVFNQQPPVLSERLPGCLTLWAALQRPLLAMTSVSSPH